MTENKWIIDGHHYMCPECGKTIAVVVNESDESFDFCPFCGKRIEGLNMADDRIEVTHLMGKKLDRPIIINWESETKKNKMEQVAAMFDKRLGESFCVSSCSTRFLLKFTSDGLWVFDDSWGHWNGEDGMLEALLRGEAVIINDK